MFFPHAKKNHGSKIIQKEAVNNNRWARQTRADIWTPFKNQKKAAFNNSKKALGKIKSFVFYTTKKTDSRRGRATREKTTFHQYFEQLQAGWDCIYQEQRKRFLHLQHTVAVHLLLRKSAPESSPSWTESASLKCWADVKILRKEKIEQ